MFTIIGQNVRIDGAAELLTVGCGVNRGWQLFNLNFESLLDFIKHSFIFIRAYEGDCQSLSSKSSCTSNSVKVGVGTLWHVVVEDDVDLLNVNASSENLSCDQDAVFELLESFVDFDSKYEVSKLVFIKEWSN